MTAVRRGDDDRERGRGRDDFGSRACVKRSGDWHAKLDRHDFTGIFLGYTATDQNVVYLDLLSKVIMLHLMKHGIFKLLDLLLLSYCMTLASRLMNRTSLFLTMHQM